MSKPKKTFTQKLIKFYTQRIKKYGKTNKKTLELKRFLNKVQSNFNPTKKQQKEYEKEWKDIYRPKRKADITYSITISYKEIVFSRRNEYEISTSELEAKVNRKKPMNTADAKQHIQKMEDELNILESTAYHTFTFVSVDNLKISNKDKLEESKMFKCNYELYNKKISKWKDTGECECVFEYLLHRYNGVHNLRLTKERIYDSMYHEAHFIERDFKKGVSCQDLERFCKWLGIPMYCVDITDTIFYKYIPDKRNKHYPVLCFICSNNHLYPIEDKKYTYSYGNIASSKVIKSNQVKDNTKSKSKKEKLIVDAENLNDRLDELIYEDKKLPTFSRYNGQVQSIVCGDIIYSACENKDKQELLCKKLNIDFTGQNMTVLGYDLFKSLYTNHKQSVMNNDILKLFKDNNKSGFAYTWREAKEGDKVITRDINKCYTSILRDNQYNYPVFNICDDVKPYDGKGLKCGYYYVETNNFFPLKGNGLYCYSTLLECRKLNINFTPKYQVLPTHMLPCDYFKPLVDQALKVDEYKTLINTTIGFLNKITTTFNQSRFTSDKNEAGYFFFNKFKPVAENDNRLHFVNTYSSELYEIETITYNKKYENDIPLYQQIIEAGWIKIYLLSRVLNGEILCVKTDSVTIANATNDVDLNDDIGGVKEEKNPEIYKNWKVSKGKFEIELKEWDTITEDQYAEDFVGEEFSWVDDIVNDIISSNEGYFIDGRAGTGKSILIKKLNKYCDDNELKYVNLAPTNKASRNINGITIHKFFGIGRDSKAINAKKFSKLKGLDYVFVDEISMVSSHLLRFLYLAKLNNKKIKFVLVGDSWQLAPVKEQAHTDTDCVKFLCDYNRVSLTINKRFDKKLRDIAEKYYLTGKINLKAFGDSEKVDRYLCYTNRKRKEVNDKLMKKHKKVKKFLELELNLDYEEDKNEPSSQDMILNIGMPIICRENCKNLELVNNEEYKVVGFDKRKQLITINNENFPDYTYDDFQKYFLPAYCITIHKSQGQTYDKPYKICEVNKIMKCSESRSLLYVSLTRARSKELINISRDEEDEPVRYSNNFIAKKVESYKQQDKNKHLINDLTVNNVQELIDSNSNICYYCKCGLYQGNFTLDRIDSSISHTINNCVCCCYQCNVRKNDLILNPDKIM